ncbi:S8 family serine peptidase [Flammeovirga agarivorans]|uniref:S8 family serine peptidase n=1 Tax=Flammeovirga agarivorans TaxID=2726742 RepID=A0A7X8SIJ2_9BACT|nr:S8 family serine peptidase [Flammeovirga agarivorans]NLR90870.1 S8 family serine peptidase [Flammeovirga agarivorans]
MKLIYTITLLLLTIQLFAQEKYYLVVFDGKDDTTYSLDTPAEYLSQEAIDRREKYNIAIDSTDLPVVASYISAVENTGATIWHPMRWFNGVIVSDADSSTISALPHVSSVLNMSDKSMGGTNTIDDIKVSTDFGNAEIQSEMIGVDKMHELGYKGEGIHIAVLDAGFKNYNSIDHFENTSFGEIYDLYSKDEIVEDDHRHGTEVLSTMAANIDGNFVGGSPLSTYSLYRTEYVNSETRIEELMWVVAAERADSLGADIIQSSLGYYDFDDPTQNYTHDDLDGETAWISLGANHAFTKGILVVVSAGNEGSYNWRKVTFPGDSPFVLTVGSVSAAGNRAYSSSTGNTADNRIKPDVMALGQGCQVIDENGNQKVSNGTSFAAPQMASFAAGLLEARPELSPIEAIRIIRASADRYTSPDSLYGYGVPDFALAVNITGTDQEPSILSIKAYPNPVDGETVKLDLPTELINKSIKVVWHDLSGKAIKKKEYHQLISTMEIKVPQKLRKQYALLHIESENGATTLKLKIN